MSLDTEAYHRIRYVLNLCKERSMNEPKQSQPENYNRILRIGEVMERTAISRSQIYHLASIGKFPRSIPLVPGGSSVGWVASEVNEGFYPVSTDGFKRAENSKSLFATRRRIRGLWKRSM